jgi:hypothetical protein
MCIIIRFQVLAFAAVDADFEEVESADGYRHLGDGLSALAR